MSKHNGDERREGCDFAVPDALSRQIGKSFEAARDLADADALRKALRLHLEEPGVSQASVARAIDRSGAAVSQWLRHEYRGDNEAVEASIRSYLDTAQKRAAVHAMVVMEFARTSVANEVLQVCSWAHTHGTVGVVYGEAGSRRRWPTARRG